MLRRFPQPDYTYDCYVTAGGAVRLVDFNPVGGTTAPLLFDWHELYGRGSATPPSESVEGGDDQSGCCGAEGGGKTGTAPWESAEAGGEQSGCSGRRWKEAEGGGKTDCGAEEGDRADGETEGGGQGDGGAEEDDRTDDGFGGGRQAGSGGEAADVVGGDGDGAGAADEGANGTRTAAGRCCADRSCRGDVVRPEEEDVTAAGGGLPRARAGVTGGPMNDVGQSQESVSSRQRTAAGNPDEADADGWPWCGVCGERHVELRVVVDPVGIRPVKAAYMVPFDFVDTSPGGAADGLWQRLQQVQRHMQPEC